jgi:hypothetical protein
MKKLQKAGLFGQIVSSLFPKTMTGHVRTEVLPNGQVQATPVFLIDDQEVPPELVGTGSSQTILGYTVTLDAASRNVRAQTQGRTTRVSKKKAAEFLTTLSRSGVAVRSKDGRTIPQIREVKPNVDLTLNQDDSLTIESELVTRAGVVLDKPADLDVLRAEDGWYAIGDDLVKVATTDTPLDDIIIGQRRASQLTGAQVPQVLKLIGQHAGQLGEIDKNPPLQPLQVFGDKTENRAKVDGDATTISIEPSLVFNSPQGRQYEQSPDATKRFAERGGGFARVEEGWIEMTPDVLHGHVQARRELEGRLGKLTDIHGPDIPKALTELKTATQRQGLWASPWTVYFSEAVKNSHKLVDNPANVEFRLNIVDRDGRSLLELDPIYNHERFRLTHAETQEAVVSRNNWIRRTGAWIKVDATKYRNIQSGIEQLGLQRGPTGFTFPASKREQVIALFSVYGSIQHSSAYADFLMKLADFDKIDEVPLPTRLHSTVQLRPYQRHGYNWLSFLHRFGLNGILADDMGLGKTLQTLAVIARASEISRFQVFPSLIICPTSVVTNWKREADKFFSETAVFTYVGQNRESSLERLAKLMSSKQSCASVMLVITSYDIARRDVEILNRIPWQYVVVDEGHNIKNPDAQRTRAIKTINGQNKLALTGTPIQNNLEELWSLFDFAMPGFLGKRSEFRDRYGRNGRVDWDAVNQGPVPLKSRVHPFIMRRLKENVAKDLPQKIMIEQVVELTPVQVSLYKDVLAGTECRRVFEEVEKKGVRRASTAILAAFTKLRNICNHPVLETSGGLLTTAKYEDSGKLDCSEGVDTRDYRWRTSHSIVLPKHPNARHHSEILRAVGGGCNSARWFNRCWSSPSFGRSV